MPIGPSPSIINWATPSAQSHGRTAVPSTPWLLSDVERREHPGVNTNTLLSTASNVRPNRSMEASVYTGATVDREAEAQARRDDAIAARKHAQQDRLMAYVTNPREYGSRVREEARQATEAQAHHKQARAELEQQHTHALERGMEQHANAQERAIQARTDARKAAYAAMARENLQAIENKRAEQLRDRGVLRPQDTSFADRFGGSLA